jgi:hypothetical protein
MSDLGTYYDYAESRAQRVTLALKCQQSGTAYFNFAEGFVGNSDLLGAHKSALWAQGFAEDCYAILSSYPAHQKFLHKAFAGLWTPAELSRLEPSRTAFANMQRMVVRYLDSAVSNELKREFKQAGLPTYGFENEAREFMSKTLQIKLSFGFGVTFVIILFVIALLKPDPTSFQYNIFRTVMALAGAATAAVFPGFIEVKFGRWLRAGGALAVFVILYFYVPHLVDTPKPKCEGNYTTTGNNSPNQPCNTGTINIH